MPHACSLPGQFSRYFRSPFLHCLVLLSTPEQQSAALSASRIYLCQKSHMDNRTYTCDAVSATMSVEKNNPEVQETTITKLSSNDRISRPDTAVAIKLEKVSLGWLKDKAPLPTDINLSIKRGTSNFIVGPSGVGKSTLLYALLGECPILEGTIATTVTDIAWFVHCCDLQEDLNSLTVGDQTRIGSKGTALSDGQKQRIALARALYSRKEVILLDDPFSGLDVTTENNIIRRCFGKTGIFSHWGTTIVIATHSSRLLPLADQIFALDSKGSISERGTYQELIGAEGYLHRTHGHRQHPLEQKLTSYSDEVDPKRASGSPNALHDTQKPESTPQAAKEKTTSDTSAHRFYIKAIGLSPMMTFLALETVWGFLSVFPVEWLKWWAEDSTSHGNNNLGLCIGVYAALQVAALACSALATPVSGCTILCSRGPYARAPLHLFAKQDSGETLTRFSQDIQMVDLNLPSQILTLTQNLFTCIAQAGLIGSGVGWVAVSYPALIAILFVIQRLYLGTAKQMRLLDLSEKAPVYSQYLDTLGGLPTIRAFVWQDRFRKANYDLVAKAQKPWYSLLIIQRWLLLVLDLVTTALTVLIVSFAVKLRSSIGTAGFAVALVQMITLSNYLNQLVNTYTMLETTLGAIARIKKFENNIVAMPGNTSSDSGKQPPPSWPEKGEVILEQVSASYNDIVEGSNRLALDGVTIHIRPGQKIGICGRTGSGKSSTVLTLFRLLELSSGRILVDGLDIATLNQEIVRSRLNGLGQDPYFLAGSVRLNLDSYQELMSNDHSNDKELIRALDAVKLWSLIQQNGGLDADLKKESLSHGQRQLFCIARAILRPGKIVVLDEIISNVDPEMEKLIQTIIISEFSNRTIIMVTYRLNTIVNYDRVAVMADGKCVEFDDPKVLLEREDLYLASF
ncbi:multidrug resistance protein [Penicillium longicatenatum]|nr:multidrug resistance protein [Penicillium longicatenatum]